MFVCFVKYSSEIYLILFEVTSVLSWLSIKNLSCKITCVQAYLANDDVFDSFKHLCPNLKSMGCISQRVVAQNHLVHLRYQTLVIFVGSKVGRGEKVGKLGEGEKEVSWWKPPCRWLRTGASTGGGKEVG